MKKKQHFYTHLVTTDSLILRLQELNLKEDEHAHLISLIESNMHHAILDAILSELTEEDKKLFLKELASDDHEAIWNFLKKRIERIEEKIEKTADELQKELHSDIDDIKV